MLTAKVSGMTDTKLRKLREFSERLQAAIDYRGFPEHGRASEIRRAFAQRGIKLSVMSVTRWITGQAMPASANLQILAEVLNVNLEWLYTGRGAMVSTAVETPDGKTVNVVVNTLPRLMAEQISDWLDGRIEVQPDILVACSVSGKAFVIELKDQSLSPRIAKGSLLVIDPARSIDDELPALAWHDGMAIFGYPATRPDGILMEPTNPSYTTTKVPADEIVGPAVAIAQQIL